MERAVIQSDLKKQEIQPKDLLKEYKLLLEKDIRNLLPISLLRDVSSPLNNELDVKQSFSKMGMNYQVSSTFGNIYISPRPNSAVLKEFYMESKARMFWMKELWPRTQEMRYKKIIYPQLEWARNFISQYSTQKTITIAEFLPNHWAYYLGADKVFHSHTYHIIEPLFDTSLKMGISKGIETSDLNDDSIDVAFLFEALERSTDPLALLEQVKLVLKPGGLCFLTCLLSSGFEVKVLGENSEIFVPPERMNLFSYHGMHALIEKNKGFEILEFSTPGVLDIPNVRRKLDQLGDAQFIRYILFERAEEELLKSFQDFIQLHRLGTFGRLVLIKK